LSTSNSTKIAWNNFADGDKWNAQNNYNL
jgi:hypothetical protein